MSQFIIKLQDKDRCVIKHELSGAEILTDAPPEFGGGGRSFSSTDMVSAALGSCILTSIDKVVERAGHDPKKLTVTVKKTLSQKPKMIKEISVWISYPEKFEEKLLKKLERATEACPVKRSLNDKVNIKIEFI